MSSEAPHTTHATSSVAETSLGGSTAASISLAALRGLRSAPRLEEHQRLQLRRELEQAITPYSWFTLGVMAPNAETALTVLRQAETALGWPPLQPIPTDPTPLSTQAEGIEPGEAARPLPEEKRGLDHPRSANDGAVADPSKSATAIAPPPSTPVFLKGNQRTGQFQLRTEAGLGVGLLITGQDAPEPIASETWGPLPLDLFS